MKKQRKIKDISEAVGRTGFLLALFLSIIELVSVVLYLILKTD